MMLSVLIPTHGRPALLERCLRSLAAQTFEGFDAEVVVGVDGADRGEADAALRRSSERLPMRALPAAHAGPAATRNRIVAEAEGETILFLNDDVEATPGLLAAHVGAQRELSGAGRCAMVLGSAPWAIVEPDRVLDRLTRETSLIFFYDRMTGAAADDPGHDWGWRHSWTLNLSLPARCVRAVGGFCERMPRPVYEDIELAYRVRERFGAPTLYRPGAGVVHHHRYEPCALLAREYVLGHQSRKLSEVSPACARELFRRDPLDPAVVAEATALVESGRDDAAREIGAFIECSLAPASSLDGAGVVGVYERYVRCRSHLRAMGLADAGRGRACEAPIGWLTALAACAVAP
jgi:glycosyltransferase involved in cell wall biosynthesis